MRAPPSADCHPSPAALTYHYETQCLPTPAAWFAHHLPVWLHKLSVVATFLIEIAVPPLFFAPVRRLRLAAFCSQVGGGLNLQKGGLAVAFLSTAHWVPLGTGWHCQQSERPIGRGVTTPGMQVYLWGKAAALLGGASLRAAGADGERLHEACPGRIFLRWL